MCTPNVDLSQISWEDASIDEEMPRSRLLATLQFNGVCHHLEAIEVKWHESTSTQSAACPSCDDILASYAEATGADGPFSTVTIDRRCYAIFVTPYCS
jgi:hypothetical protein